MVGLVGLLKGPSALELRTHSLFGTFTAFPGFELVDEGRNMEGRVGVRDIFEYRNRIGGWMLYVVCVGMRKGVLCYSPICRIKFPAVCKIDVVSIIYQTS